MKLFSSALYFLLQYNIKVYTLWKRIEEGQMGQYSVIMAAKDELYVTKVFTWGTILSLNIFGGLFYLVFVFFIAP